MHFHKDPNRNTSWQKAMLLWHHVSLEEVICGSGNQYVFAEKWHFLDIQYQQV